MLESDDELTRVYGWDALRLVFNKETQIVGEYNPRASSEDCRSKVATLKATMVQSSKKPSSVDDSPSAISS